MDDRGDYNSSPCTSHRRAKKSLHYFNLLTIFMESTLNIKTRHTLANSMNPNKTALSLTGIKTACQSVSQKF